MSDQDDLRSPRDIDVDAERFLDDDVDDATPVPSAIDVPAEGSIPDIIDQHTDVPDDDEP